MLRQIHIPKDYMSQMLEKQDANFEEMLKAARLCDSGGLYKAMYNNSGSINSTGNKFTHYDPSTVVMVMAVEGNHDAVNMLVDEFKACVIDVCEGYARAKNVEKVNEWIGKCADKDKEAATNAAVRGFAYAGDQENVGHLIMKGASIAHAVGGAAFAGRSESVDTLIKTCPQQKAVYRVALDYYARAENYAQVERMLLEAVKKFPPAPTSHKWLQEKRNNDNLADYCGDAVLGYTIAGSMHNQDRLMKLLAHSNIEQIRKAILDLVGKEHHFFVGNMPMKDLVSKADDIRAAMAVAPETTYEAALAAWAPKPAPEPKPKHVHHHHFKFPWSKKCAVDAPAADAPAVETPAAETPATDAPQEVTTTPAEATAVEEARVSPSMRK